METSYEATIHDCNKIIISHKAKLKKVCGSTNMDIFLRAGGRIFFFNIFFSTCKYTVLPLDTQYIGTLLRSVMPYMLYKGITG